MKMLTLPIVIVLAIALLVWLLLRGRIGRRFVVRSRFAHRIVRTAAVFLLVLGFAPAVAADEPPKDDTESQPEIEHDANEISAEKIGQWLETPVHAGHIYGRHFKQHYITLRDKRTQADEAMINSLIEQHRSLSAKSPLSALLWFDLRSRLRGEEPTSATTRQLLNAANWLEQNALYDAWFIAYIWTHSREVLPAESEEQRQDLKDLYRNLARSARITDALVLAHAEVQPVAISPRAWMSKAGPRTEDIQQWNEDTQAMHRAFQRIYPTVDIGTWASDGGAMLTLGENMPALTLVRAGEAIQINPGESFHFQRLDLLETPSADHPLIIHHDWLGEVSLAPDALLSVWDLPAALSDQQRLQVRHGIVQAAEIGDDASMSRLERSLPLIWPRLTDEANQLDGDAGARLRTLLALFDDTLTLTSVLEESLERWERRRRFPDGSLMPE